MNCVRCLLLLKLSKLIEIFVCSTSERSLPIMNCTFFCNSNIIRKQWPKKPSDWMTMYFFLVIQIQLGSSDQKNQMTEWPCNILRMRNKILISYEWPKTPNDLVTHAFLFLRCTFFGNSTIIRKQWPKKPNDWMTM